MSNQELTYELWINGLNSTQERYQLLVEIKNDAWERLSQPMNDGLRRHYSAIYNWAVRELE